MAIANSDILAYVMDNRLFYEEGEYLLQSKVETMGEDAIGSARTWMYARFFHAGELATFDAFMKVTYDDLTPGDLTNIEDVRAAYLVITTEDSTTSLYTMLFEAFVRLSVAYIWKAAGMEGNAEVEEKFAQQLISSIVGALADPDNVIGGGDGDMEEAALGTVVSVHALTADEIKEYTGGYE